MFQIGDLVSYRAEGVCSIADIRTERFGTIGGDAEYYILSPLRDQKSLLYVPVHNPQLCALMRPLLTAEEIGALFLELRDERMVWIPESRARNVLYRDILSRGDRRELIVLVNSVCDRMLNEFETGQKATGTDENALRRAMELLYDEFSVTCELPNETELLAAMQGKNELTGRVAYK